MKTTAEIKNWWENAPRTEFSEQRYPISTFFRPSFWLTYASLMRSQWYPLEKLRSIQERKLQKLIAHCYANVPYYTRLFDQLGLKPENIRTVQDLAALPLLTKEDIRNNAVDLTARNADLTQVQIHRTGGSTGEPLSVLVSPRMIEFEMAVLYRFLSWMGVRPWHRQVHFRTTSNWGRNAPLATSSLFGIVTKLSPFDLSEKAMTQYRRTLLELKPGIVSGNPSTLTAVAKFLVEHGNEGLAPKAVETSSEILYPEQRKTIEKGINALVFDFYGGQEHAVNAQECDHHQGLHVNMEYGILELLPVEDIGEKSRMRQIVGTSLENYTMPLLRYQIHDMATLSPEPCTCGREATLLERIQGKKRDLIVLRNGQVVGGEIFTLGLEEVKGLTKYQVIQKSFDDILVRTVVENGFDLNEFKDALARVQSVFTCPVTMRHEIVESIEATGMAKFHVIKSEVLK